jgi:hypothetical protein
MERGHDEDLMIKMMGDRQAKRNTDMMRITPRGS